MGRLRKKYNSKARQSVSIKAKANISKEETQCILSDELKKRDYVTDTGNTLVVVPQIEPEKELKEKGRKSSNLPKPERKLTKKQRKKLQKIVDKKKKKLERKDLLDALSKVQVSQEELEKYKSVATLGQIQGKRKYDDALGQNNPDMTINALRGKKKGKKERLKKKLAKLNELKEEESGSKESEVSTTSESEDELEIETNEDSITNAEKIQMVRESSEVASKGEEATSFGLSTLQIQPVVVDKDMKKEQVSSNPAIHVDLQRRQEIQEARLQLPILAEEQQVMETFQENPVTILCGETGSGKTTQVPQFLYEAGYSSSSLHPSLIGITQPRRVAAISMSKRVAEEMNLPERIVSYQIRYEGNVTEETRIKFMTDGVLLKEIENDFLLSKYSVLIIDEAHERSVFTDILIGLLSRIVPLRNKRNNPLKLIIMSATLRIEDFTQNKRLFPTVPPLIKVDSRQYPVTIHFNKRTVSNYLEEAFKKACKIHRTLKLGGILIFVTGQNEVHTLSKRLRRTFPLNLGKEANVAERNSAQDSNLATGDHGLQNDAPITPEVNLDSYSAIPALDLYDDGEDDSGSDRSSNFSDDEEEDSQLSRNAHLVDAQSPMYVLPLYSLLSSRNQAKVFRDPPQGSRLCVVATNVAETSLTIPGITYVIDTGMVKRKLYDKVTGVSSFRVTWTSKASANQRAGRAGRVEPGHCYRLYSSAVFQNEFEDFSEPEILRRPVEDLLLQMKGMGIDKVKNFPFPTPPDTEAIRVSENLLLDLGALEKKKNKNGEIIPVVTDLGKALAKIPVAPRYSKMIWLSHEKDCMQYIITIVAALTVREIFTDDIEILHDVASELKDDAKKKRILITQARRKWAGEGESALLGDLMVILRAVGACEFSGCTEKFCADNGLRYKAMVEIRKLRAQLTSAANAVIPDARAFVNAKMKPPTPTEATIIRQIVLSCLGDRVARKLRNSGMSDPKLKNAYQSCSLEDPVFIHPSSSLFTKLPDYIVYQEIQETTKMYMKGVTAVDPSWLPVFVPHKCKFSKPAETPPPSFDADTGHLNCHMTFSFGPHMWSFPAQELRYPPGMDRYRWFGKFLLEGKVLKKLAEFSPYLLTPASVMVKSWSKLQPKTETFLNALAKEDVFSRSRLIKAFEKDPSYLLNVYKDWIPESKQVALTLMWPPLD